MYILPPKEPIWPILRNSRIKKNRKGHRVLLNTKRWTTYTVFIKPIYKNQPRARVDMPAALFEIPNVKVSGYREEAMHRALVMVTDRYKLPLDMCFAAYKTQITRRQ